ncbi:MAG: PsiF family protein [Gammaproteobacteria bacterium]
MRKLFVPLFITLSAAAFVLATNASAQIKTPTPQQQKFAECAHQSKGMKGEAHKKFMSECLKGSGAAASMKSEASKAKTEAGKAEEKTKSVTSEQREKMKNCNAQAKEKNLKGKDRRSFMSECLKD